MSVECKHLFVLNPAAGGNDNTSRIAGQIDSIMGGREYSVVCSRYPGHVKELLEDALDSSSYWRVYACGGDGTLNEVLNACGGGKNIAIAHYPCGTGNDFVRIFGKDALFSLEELVDGDIVPSDVIKTNHGLALNVVSMGFDAQVAGEMSRFRRLNRFGAKVPYNLGVLASVFKGLYRKVSVKIDGTDYSGDYTMIAVMNGGWYGGGYHAIPEAVFDDGLLDVMLVKKVSIFGLVRHIDAYAKGEHGRLSFCRWLRAKHIEIICKSPCAATFDGECSKISHLDITCRTKEAAFIVPKSVIASKTKKN